MSAQPMQHDPEAHTSFIKTPQQLITIVVLAFVVPVVLIILLAKAVVSMRAPDPAVLAPEAVAARIKPVADLVIRAGGAPATGAKSGEEVYKSVCTACHQTGVANAPKFGDKGEWAERIKQGRDTVVTAAINGIRGMPPRGGNPSLSDGEVTRAVVYMANAAGANWKEPEAPAAGKPAAPPPSAAPAAAAPAASAPAPSSPGPAAASAPAGATSTAEGKAVYDRVCVACHQTGVAGAPKFGDKAAWAPRIATGMDALYASVLKGKGAMPPKGGQMAAPDAEIKAAVDYMVAAGK
jgi:cytochrome c5